MFEELEVQDLPTLAGLFCLLLLMEPTGTVPSLSSLFSVSEGDGWGHGFPRAMDSNLQVRVRQGMLSLHKFDSPNLSNENILCLANLQLVD